MLRHLGITVSALAILFTAEIPTATAEDLTAQEPTILTQASGQGITFLELMWLNEDGGGIEAAQAYFEQIGPIVQRYGATFEASYRPVEVLNGYLQAPDFIFAYTFPSEEALRAFGSDPQFQDPDYAALIPTRNRIFNFDDKILFRVEPF